MAFKCFLLALFATFSFSHCLATPSLSVLPDIFAFENEMVKVASTYSKTIEVSSSEPRAKSKCPCAKEELCLPIKGKPVREKEVFGYIPAVDPKLTNWSRVTTIAWVKPEQTELICTAHAHGVRVILPVDNKDIIFSSNTTERKEWAKAYLARVQANFMDGVTFDYEDPETVGSKRAKLYSLLIQDTAYVFHQENPSYQISTAVPWSPDNIDGRGYDFPSIAIASDLIYVMDYDTRSQIFDACIASANAPFPGAKLGISRYLDIGIDPKKIVLGVPWYGYRYECSPETKLNDRFCSIKPFAFRGVNCSDGIGREVAYKNIIDIMRQNRPHLQFDEYMKAPFFSVKEQHDADRGKVGVVQYWFDNPQSLSIKYRFAREAGLLGVGPFTFGHLDPIKQPAESRAMWAALDSFFQ
uniref:GH18 domain-containing protein n=1 Tax=Aplanochytrium stocchinoi TaxID=215587 RepID=A0A7S3V1K8_9STRA